MTALFFFLLAVDITSDIWHNKAPDNNVMAKIRHSIHHKQTPQAGAECNNKNKMASC